MPEIAIPLLLLDHIEPIEPANSLLGGLEPLLVTSLRGGGGEGQSCRCRATEPRAAALRATYAFSNNKIIYIRVAARVAARVAGD